MKGLFFAMTMNFWRRDLLTLARVETLVLLSEIVNTSKKFP